MSFVRSFVRSFTQKPQAPIKQVQKAAVKKAPSGPTKAEMEEERIKKASLANKRRGRKATMLTGADGAEDLSLSKKTILG
tara:strand:+ start:436 stop:675 length:240 start_codon:yes stop_codon:yes gene_type:complete